MSLRKAPPGPQLSTGRVRVDAARAIAKLREYQLADRSAWVLEGIRAAVASGAKHIDVSADSNDVWLAWEGEPWPEDVLPRLLDELVSPEAAAERQHVRLLAAAVNSALGLSPSYVDVTAIHDGTAKRVRYTPEILVEPAAELGEVALRHVAVETVSPPAGRARGMLVHVRRRLVDWHVFSEARELWHARAACRDIAVPLRVGEAVLQRSDDMHVVQLRLGEGIDGYIAITEAERATEPAVFAVAERGVVLVEYPFEIFDAAPRAPVPIRVFVDAPRMPTNASRSQVRRDAHPIASAERSAHKLLPELIAQLAAATRQGSERARASALALLAAFAGGPKWHVDMPAVDGPLRELAMLPLVENAVGTRRTLTHSWRAEVYTGDRPLPAELAPWLDTVLWAPPRDASSLLVRGVDLDTGGTRRLVRWARKQLRAQKQFYAHARREARVQTSVKPYIRVPLGCEVAGSVVEDEVFENLTGEVCIYREGEGGALAVLLDGRELERIEFESPFAYDVVIDSSTVSPGERYRGVKRDSAYYDVVDAMKAGLVRAFEAHAKAGRDQLRDDELAADARLMRKGFDLLRVIGRAAKGPLKTARIFPAVDGTWKCFADLENLKVIGVAPPGRAVAVPRGRVVLALDRAEAAELGRRLSADVVYYTRESAGDIEAHARKLAAQLGGALVIREPGVQAVVAPGWMSELHLWHLGVELAVERISALLSCTVIVDSDDIVPDESWSGVVDDAGFRSRNYTSWELAFVRAIARALLGEQVPELVTSEPVTLTSRLGTVLCDALTDHEPVELLGKQLLEKLCTAPLVHVLGGSAPCTIVEAVAPFEGPVPYLTEPTEPIAGFAPILASTSVAHTLCRLVGRTATNGASQLEQRRREQLRARRLAEHREQETQPLMVPAEHVVELPTERVRGVVGVWDDVFTIRVFVEWRPFAVLHPPNSDVPLVAAVELSEQDCNTAFDGVRDDVAEAVVRAVRATAQTLLVEIAKQAPHLLADDGPVRRLLAKTELNDEVRDTLRRAPAFPTIQGGRASIESVAEPLQVVSIASWQGEWLGPDEGEASHAYDNAILFVPSATHELAGIVDALHGEGVVDLTEEVSQFQARRRMARGLLPRPRVRVPHAHLTRALSAFARARPSLEHGEIALAESITSRLLVHDHGSLVGTEELDVMPAIELAIDKADRHVALACAQELAVELAESVLAETDVTTLSPLVQRNLVRAAFAKRLPDTLLKDLPLWRDFVAQHEELGNVWVACEPTDLEPLDDKRRVFVFDRDDYQLARAYGWRVIEAEPELALDAIARRNRAKPAATALELPWGVGVLATEQLGGDGATSPRGVVGVLAPAAEEHRGVLPHREMHPFERVEDPCRWPTLAVIDDARLAPDRTWSKPVPNVDWRAVAKEIRAASERALAKVGEVPVHALVHVRVTTQLCANLDALRKAPRSVVRGAFWIAGPPLQKVAVQVHHEKGSVSIVPEGRLGIGGVLYVYAPETIEIDRVVHQLAMRAHGKLVRALVKQKDVDRDLVAAHVAHAVATRTARATDFRSVELPCFAPRPIDARAFSSILRRPDPVTVIRPGAPPSPDPHAIEVVDDRSEVARVVIEALGDRVRRSRPAPKPRPAPEAPPLPKRTPARRSAPEPPHPLEPLVKKLRRRLSEVGIGGYEWIIENRAEPMFAYAGAIVVAGDNVRLRALAAALAAKSPFADAGVDVVVAHLVTVLNIALSQITDASEEHALRVLLTQQSEGRPRSRRSS